MKIIGRNLFFAFCYNVILSRGRGDTLSPIPGMPPALQELNPMLAALAMSLSSISVVTNSLLLSKTHIE